MAITTFSIELIKGAPVFHYKGNIILLDTGAPKTINTSTELFFLGQSFNVITTYGPINMQTISGNMDSPITTLLGMDILKDYRIIFDYKNKQISLLTEDEEEVEGEEIPMSNQFGLPVIQVAPADKNIPMFLDSGAHISYLKSQHTHDHKNFGQTEDFHPTIGRFTTTKFLMYSKIGEHYIEVHYGNLPTQLLSYLSIINGDNGILGYDFFAKFKICLDMKKMKLTLMDGPYRD